MKTAGKNYTKNYLSAATKILDQLDSKEIENAIDLLVSVKQKGGRLFFLGVGGSAANCSHAVNDFRKIARFESYAPTDNVAELTARTNDEGWATTFVSWLEISHLSPNDAIMVLSVGGGNLEKNTSLNIVIALEYAKKIGSSILGIVSRDGGHTRKVTNTSILIRIDEAEYITPISESFQALIWHLIVNHPKLKG
ncbi:SIS domain-containing protein [Candidatus Daviesbacteria bacterium]|nr:SIS domain-containing protein [Candidatus Daviesbacteria bacterium]